MIIEIKDDIIDDRKVGSVMNQNPVSSNNPLPKRKKSNKKLVKLLSISIPILLVIGFVVFGSGGIGSAPDDPKAANKDEKKSSDGIDYKEDYENKLNEEENKEGAGENIENPDTTENPEGSVGSPPEADGTDSTEPFAGYDLETLKAMALQYYERRTGNRPRLMTAEKNASGQVVIQVHEKGTSDAVDAQYTVDAFTGRGTDAEGNAVDLAELNYYNRN